MTRQIGRLLGLQTPIRLEGEALGMGAARTFPVFQIVLAGCEENLLCLNSIVAVEVDGPRISVFLHVLDANAALDFGPCLGRELQKGLIENAPG